MAGHSKWANIKHRKARQDAVKGKAWSKCSRAIIMAARRGGGDPEFNTTLRFAIDSFGADRLFLGSDYPFAIMDPDPIRSALAVELDDAAREAILEGNAKRFLGW